MKEHGVQVEPEPEWDGPDPLMEMVRKAHRMVPESRIAEAVAAERARIIEAAEWLTLADATDDTKPTVYWDGWLAGIAAVLALLDPKP